MSDFNKIPLFPLGVVLFPDVPLPLHIFEERYKMMIGECLETDSVFGIALYTDGKIFNTGCTAKIINVLKKYEDGRMDILIQGVERFVIENIIEDKPYLQADVQFLPNEAEQEIPVNADLQENAILFLKKVIESMGQDTGLFTFEEIDSRQLSYLLAAYGWFTTQEKQELLEIDDTTGRLKRELELRETVIRRLEFSKRMKKISQSNGRLQK
jgi:Lon protease-like protein